MPRSTKLGDGSRVDKRLRFHSSLLGDLRLAIKDVRSVDRVSSNAVKLVTAATGPGIRFNGAINRGDFSP
jgi:hypothetical protein